MKTMLWKKLGIAYVPDGSDWWARSHAMIPTPLRLDADTVRVFITCCDAGGVGRPCYVDLSAHDPRIVVGVSRQPLLDVGAPGTFDENGVLTCGILDLGAGKVHMYYAGFELGTKIRYRLLTGLATSEDGGSTFRRYSSTPVLERSEAETYFRGGPYCLYDQQCFRLWYVGGSHWTEIEGKSMPVYDIRYAESEDGVHWPEQGDIQIPITEADEFGFGRPCVIPKVGGGYRMFYSIRRRSMNAYRLGYAESDDGHKWVRMDSRLNLDVGEGGFDSDAIMYAAPIQVEDKLYVFYNGNEFGLHGFAVAELEVE